MGSEKKKNLVELEGSIAETEQALETLKKKTGGGSKLSRSEIVTVRLDPKLRYLAELAARKQRRTVSSFIEWAIEDALKHIEMLINNDYSRSLAQEATLLWDIDESDRFAKLAIHYPELLNHEEQLIWKLIVECQPLWPASESNVSHVTKKTQIDEENLDFHKLRKHWDIFKCVASGKMSAQALSVIQ